MTAQWPTAELDPVQRLRAAAAGVRGAAVTERVVPAEFSTVWSMLTDFEDSFAQIQPDMRKVKIIDYHDDRVVLLAASRYGLRARLVGTLRPGWCWLQSRFLIIAMAAAPEPTGGTRVALTGGIRIPRRPAILPIRVRAESNRSLDNLQQLLANPT